MRKLDDSDADVDNAGSYGEIADRHRAAHLEGKTEGDIPRDKMEWARSGERGGERGVNAPGGYPVASNRSAVASTLSLTWPRRGTRKRAHEIAERRRRQGGRGPRKTVIGGGGRTVVT